MKKTYLILLIIIAVISSGCQNGIQKQVSKPEDTVKNFLTALQNLEFKDSLKYVENAPDNYYSPFEGKLIRSCFANMEYEIEEVLEKDSGDINVKVVTSAPNLGEALDIAYHQILADRSYNSTNDQEALLNARTFEILNKKQAPIFQTTTTFTLLKDLGDWYILYNEQFENFALRMTGY